MRVLIAPDAFKGSLDAAAAAQAMAAGWRRQRPQDQLDLCPLADGGDGFGPVLAHWLGAAPRLCDTVDAAGRPRRARWWLAPSPLASGPGLSRSALPPGGQPSAPAVPGAPPEGPATALAAQASPQPALAIVESAEIIGLALLPPALRHPLPPDGQPPDDVPLTHVALTDVLTDEETPEDLAPAGVVLDDVAPPHRHNARLAVEKSRIDRQNRDNQDINNQDLDNQERDNRGLNSRGLAPVLLAAAQAGVERLLIGLGGSATNDGGFGLARALGWRFFDGDGAAIRRWGELERLERLEPPPQPPPLPQLVIAVDVRNPLLGPEGATAVYGPQKGLSEGQLPRAEACLRRLAQCLEARFPGVAERPGSGAAGGLGYGLQVCCGGRLRAGAELVAELCDLEARLQAADLVIAGEGRFDGQSLMGKGTGRLLRRAQRAGRPSLLLVGQLDGAAWREAQAEAAAQGCPIAARALVPDFTDLPQACAAPALWLERLAQRAAADRDALSLGAEP